MTIAVDLGRKATKQTNYMRIVCQKTILMKDHAFFVIFEKAAKFEIVYSANYRWRFMG